jgi:hypothetical protein
LQEVKNKNPAENGLEMQREPEGENGKKKHREGGRKAVGRRHPMTSRTTATKQETKLNERGTQN